MAVDDLWFRTKLGADGKKIPTQRHGRGKRWRVRWNDPETGLPRSESWDRKPDADRRDANIQADISRGQYIDTAAGKVTVREFAEDWRGQQSHRASTAERVERAFRLHVYPALGDLELRKVRPSHIRSWKADLSKVLAGSSLGVVFVDLKAMFTDAMQDRLLGFHPFAGVAPPSVETEERFIPSPEQIAALAEALPPRYRPIPFLAAGTGLRPSELRGLELSNMNFLAREVRVEQQLLWSRAAGVHIAKPKTATSRRTVELPQVVIDVLAASLESYPSQTLRLPDLRDPRKPETRSVRLVFTTETGGALYGGSWSGTWSRAVRRAGLPSGFGLHGLRHYFATLLIHNGKSVKTVQMALGHSKPSITLDTYTHEWPDSHDRTRDIVDAVFGARPVSGVDTARVAE